MRRSTEKIGKTIEEAIRKGLEELKVARDEVKVEVIEEPSKGSLGILSAKLAKVKLTVEKSLVSDTAVEITKKKTEEILKEIFKIVKEEVNYSIKAENGKVEVLIDSENAAHLIGYKGKTTEALQSLINNILHKEEMETAKVFIDVNGYKKKKEEIIKNLARKMADNVVKFKKVIRLEPMSAYERMIIHTELAERKDVATESMGEEPRRRVVIKLKN